MSNWISVETETPKHSMNVRVIANDIVSEFEDDISVYVCPEYGTVIWEDTDGEDYVPIVTHWKPA